MATINLYGASGHSKVIIEILKSQGDEVGILYDDNPPADEIFGHPVVKPTDTTVEDPLIISIGSNRIRRMLAGRYAAVDYATAIHPRATISPRAQIGAGTVVMAGAVIESEARIGRHCIINTSATVNHECRIGDYVHLSPGATLCGNVTVGEGSWIGAGATVIPGITIGRDVTVGAGSTVIRDIPDGQTVAGVPARELNKS